MKLFYVACVAAIAFAACEDKTSLSSTADGAGTPVKIGFLVSGDRIISKWGEDRGGRSQRARGAIGPIR